MKTMLFLTRRAVVMAVAVLAMVFSVDAQPLVDAPPLRSINGNDYLRVEVKRCYAVGKKLRLELQFCNKSQQDLYVRNSVPGGYVAPVAWDDQGTRSERIELGLKNGEMSNGLRFAIPAGLSPIVTVDINDLDPAATEIYQFKMFLVAILAGDDIYNESLYKLKDDIILRHILIDRGQSAASAKPKTDEPEVMEIVGNDYFKVGVTRCYFDGSKVRLNLLLVNNSKRDLYVRNSVPGGFVAPVAWDDQGTRSERIELGLKNGEMSNDLRVTIPAYYCAKANVVIENLDIDATKINQLKMFFMAMFAADSDIYNEALYKFKSDVILRDLPIEQ